ncbi:MAG: phosphatase PAP2 family protein [Chitinophagaceae bacterium]|nr:MAG: phosphatase PAP2 family protein [Chitinophagaceae bacterium]
MVDNKKKWSGRLKILGLDLSIILLSFITSVIIMLVLVKLVFFETGNQLDTRAFHIMGGYVSDRSTALMEFFSFLGSHRFLVPANLFLIAYAIFIQKNTWQAINIGAIAVSSLILMFTLKALFNRPRPETPLLYEVPGLSFPSGHAFMSFTFYGLLIYLTFRQAHSTLVKYGLSVMFLICIVMIGLSRIYLRVHYATDVAAGFSLGMIWLVISLKGLQMIEKNKSKLPQVD